MTKQGRLPVSTDNFMNTLANHADSDGKNLLHEAALALVEGDSQYFFALLRLKFPLYGEDQSLDFAAFIVCEVEDDNTFLSALNALLQQGFNINSGNDDDESFL